MGDAKRVDLRILCDMSTSQMTEGQADALRDAIAEIEAARATEPPALVSGEMAAIVRLVVDALREVAPVSSPTPSRAERLMRYRCAVMAAYPLAKPDAVETGAHAMLAAEREPSP
jgi:hypothetical protein